ncbi:MAG: protein kinase domain-containing protein [Chloroflexota bacterium]
MTPFAKSGNKPLKPGDIFLNRYKVEGTKGEGAFGIVYAAQDLTLPRKAAIKQLKSISNQLLVEKFVREAHAMAEVYHPNAVFIYEFVDPEKYRDVSSYYIVMEFLNGGTLRDRIRDQSINYEDGIHVIKEVLHCLEYAHQLSIYHRDIKPENILFGTKPVRVKIGDWGLAHLEDYHLTDSGSVMGTLTYMSPEQASGRSDQVDGRSDLYSVGVILYELVTEQLHHDFDAIYSKACSDFIRAHPGEPAQLAQHYGFEACLHAIAHQPPTDPMQVQTGIPRGLRDLLLKAVAIDPRDRFQTAEEFITALDDALKSARMSPKSTIIDERISKVASLLVQARQLGQQHQYTEAIEALMAARQIIEFDAGLCLELARIYNLMGRRKDATEVLEQASRRNVDNYVLLRDLGITYMALREYDKALEALRKSLKLNPNQDRVHRLIETLMES